MSRSDTIAELEAMLLAELAQITQIRIRQRVSNTKKRCEAVVAVIGQHTMGEKIIEPQ